jgi:DNA-binding FadR family transcriptional regulator
MTDDRIAEIRNFPSAEHEMFEAVMMENMLLELSGNALLAIVVRALGVANIHTTSHTAPPFGLRDVIAINRRILKAIERGDISAASELASTKLAVMQRATQTFREVA